MVNLLKILSLTFVLSLYLSACGGSGSSSNTNDTSSESNSSNITNEDESSQDDSSTSSGTTTLKITNYLTSPSSYSTTSSSSSSNTDDLMNDNKNSHEEEDDYTYDSSLLTEVNLSDSYTISSSGVYKLSGTINDGQVLVDAGDDDIVKLILNGVDIYNSTSAPIFIKNASKVIVFLEENTVNTLSDSITNEEKGVLLSKSNLSMTGEGTLNITSNYDDALRSNDGLIIKSGTYNITSTDDSIRGKDYLIIDGGTFNLTAQGDGLKSDNEDDEDRGYILVKQGTFNISAANDGIQAQTDLLITGGSFVIETAGGSSSTISDDISAKGLKSDLNLIIDGGTFDIDSADDSIHTNSSIILNAGDYNLSTADDAIHSDVILEVNGGTFNIENSYEGIESATVNINNGYFNITSSDDGLNAAGDDTTGNYYINIEGGFIVLNTSGDGLDANGYINMNDGVVIVNGPTSSGNGAIDYDRTFNITSGILVASGSSRMAETPSTSSTQYTIATEFNSTITAGTLFTLMNSSNEILLTFESSKNYQSIVFSSPDIVADTYMVYKGGSVEGTSYDGIYREPEYTNGSLYKTFSVNSTITEVN